MSQLPLLTVAQDSLSSDVGQLTNQMYTLYTQGNYEPFMAVTDRLKELTRTTDERLFYRAWANQALLTFRKQNREKGQSVLQELKAYAETHDSRFGLYVSMSTNTSMMSMMGMTEQAEKGYYDCIDYLHRYFPNESAAANYLGVARICYNREDFDKVVELCESALKEPDVLPVHRQNALAYICIAIANPQHEVVDTLRFIRNYEAWHQLKEKASAPNLLDPVVEYHHARLNGDYDSALAAAMRIKERGTRLSILAAAYELKGRYREANRALRAYKKYVDSVNSAEQWKQATEHALQLSVAKVENEAKDLRLANQNLKLWVSVFIGVLAVGFLSLYLYRRNRHTRELETAYSKLEDAYSQLEETTSAKERIESELRIAREIQMSMVPQTFDIFPPGAAHQLYASMIPAKEVGGDLYDFLLQGDKLYLCVGDVSGKGVPASMTMAVAVNLFRTFAKEGFPPAYIATRLNDTLASGNRSGMFVTMFIADINLTTGRMDFCNAGHTPPVIIAQHPSPITQHPSPNTHFMEMETNVPIGLFEGMEFVGESLENIKGHPLFIYTDGLTEAENPQLEQYGEERLIEVLSATDFRSPKSTVASVSDSVRAFVGSADMSDDRTMLCLSVG